MDYNFVTTCRKIMDGYFDSYGLEFVHSDDENIPDGEGMIEKRTTVVSYAKAGLIVELINTMESEFEIRFFKLSLERDYRSRITLYELDNNSHDLRTIRRARSLEPIEWMLHYTSWEERTEIMIKALEESAVDILSGDFSKWDEITTWIKGYRKRWSLDEPIEPTD